MLSVVSNGPVARYSLVDIVICLLVLCTEFGRTLTVALSVSGITLLTAECSCSTDEVVSTNVINVLVSSFIDCTTGTTHAHGR